MLVISRREGERFFVGPNQEIEIIIVQVQYNKVRVGIVADRSIPVMRSELLPFKERPTDTNNPNG